MLGRVERKRNSKENWKASTSLPHVRTHFSKSIWFIIRHEARHIFPVKVSNADLAIYCRNCRAGSEKWEKWSNEEDEAVTERKDTFLG